MANTNENTVPATGANDEITNEGNNKVYSGNAEHDQIDFEKWDFSNDDVYSTAHEVIPNPTGARGTCLIIFHLVNGFIHTVYQTNKETEPQCVYRNNKWVGRHNMGPSQRVTNPICDLANSDIEFDVRDMDAKYNPLTQNIYDFNEVYLSETESETSDAEEDLEEDESVEEDVPSLKQAKKTAFLKAAHDEAVAAFAAFEAANTTEKTVVGSKTSSKSKGKGAGLFKIHEPEVLDLSVKFKKLLIESDLERSLVKESLNIVLLELDLEVITKGAVKLASIVSGLKSKASDKPEKSVKSKTEKSETKKKEHQPDPEWSAFLAADGKSLNDQRSKLKTACGSKATTEQKQEIAVLTGSLRGLFAKRSK